MKKALFLLPFLLLSTTLTSGCQSQISNNTVTTTPTSIVNPSPPTTVEITTTPTTEQPTTEEPTIAPTEQPTEAIEKELLNENGVRITYLGFEESSDTQKLKIRVENNSKKKYTLEIRDVYVNDSPIPPLFSCEVESGQTSNTSITFFNIRLNEDNIKKIKHVEFYFHIYNLYRDFFDTDIISIDI